MNSTSQKQAIKNYRKRLSERGMARFEVLGLDADRELIRTLAKRLSDDCPDSARIREIYKSPILDSQVKPPGSSAGPGDLSC